MAINYTVSYSFSPSTTIASSQVNTNFNENANTWTGLEALTKSFAALRVDATPTNTSDVAIKSYVDKLNSYRRPVLQYATTGVVNVETGLNGTSGQVQILFPDGTVRTDSSSTRINMDITRTASFSGTAQSGLDTGSATNNRWYAIYICKVTDSTTNIVTVASLLLPTQANFATLNSRLGTQGWVYLGLIRYGDNSGTANVILKFVQAGNFTTFYNVLVGQESVTETGVQLTQTSSASSLTYTTSSGSGATDIPNNVTQVLFQYASANAAIGNELDIKNSAGTRLYAVFLTTNAGGTGNIGTIWGPAAEGLKLAGNAITGPYDINVYGFVDGALGIGANPLL